MDTRTMLTALNRFQKTKRANLRLRLVCYEATETLFLGKQIRNLMGGLPLSLQRAIEDGADSHLNNPLLDKSILTGELAWRLMEHGAMPGQLMLTELSNWEELGKRGEQGRRRLITHNDRLHGERFLTSSDWFRKSLIKAAQLAPQLDWYRRLTKKQNPEQDLLAEALEKRVPGFVKELEEARGKLKIAPGPSSTDIKACNEALADALSDKTSKPWIKTCGRWRAVVTMLDKGADPNARMAGDGSPPVIAQAVMTEPRLVPELIKRGAIITDEALEHLGIVLQKMVQAGNERPICVNEAVTLMMAHNKNWDVPVANLNDHTQTLSLAQCLMLAYPKTMAEVELNLLEEGTEQAKSASRRSHRL